MNMKSLFKACTVRLGYWVATSEYVLITVSQYFVHAEVYVYSKNILFYW